MPEHDRTDDSDSRRRVGDLSHLVRRQVDRLTRAASPIGSLAEDAPDEARSPSERGSGPADETRGVPSVPVEPAPSDAAPSPEPEATGPPPLPRAASAPPRPRASSLSYAKLARQERIRGAVSRAATQREQPPLPLDLPARMKAARMRIETREELLERLLDPELTLTETAKILEVCPATVRRYADKGALPHHRTPGNQRRFKLRDVLSFLDRRDRSVVEDVGDEEARLGE